MPVASLPPLFSSLFSLLAIASLLLAFAILASRWVRRYLQAFALQSWMIAGISAAVAYAGHYPELYLVAALTALFRGCLLPWLLWRMVGKPEAGRELHLSVQASSSLVIGALAVLFALVVANRLATALGLADTVAVLALTVMLAMEMIGFLLLAVRHEAISQVLGLLVLENGVFLGAQMLIPGMPLFIEIVLLFDLLIMVLCFGLLARHLRANLGATSATALRRLVG